MNVLLSRKRHQCDRNAQQIDNRLANTYNTVHESTANVSRLLKAACSYSIVTREVIEVGWVPAIHRFPFLQIVKERATPLYPLIV